MHSRLVGIGLLVAAWTLSAQVTVTRDQGRVVIANTAAPQPSPAAPQTRPTSAPPIETGPPPNDPLHAIGWTLAYPDAPIRVERFGKARTYLLFRDAPAPFAVAMSEGENADGVFPTIRQSDVTSLGADVHPQLIRAPSPYTSIISSTRGTPEGVDRLPGVLHLYVGRNPDGWTRNIPLFRSVRYRAVMPGIDSIVTSDEVSVTTEFVLAPGTDLTNLHLHYPMQVVAVRADGTLVTRSGNVVGNVAQPALELFQSRGDAHFSISGGVEIRPSSMYLPLTANVVDPALPIHIRIRIMKWAKWHNSGRTSDAQVRENGAAAAIDANGAVYTASGGFCACSERGGGDVTVVTRHASSGELAWTAVLGGATAGESRSRYSIALDARGNVVVGAAKEGSDAPYTHVTGDAAYATAFLSRIAPDGQLQFAAPLPVPGPRSSDTRPAGVAVTAGMLCAAATLDVGAAATVLHGHAARGLTDGYVACFAAEPPHQLRFASFVGGAHYERLAGIAAGEDGSLYVVGSTQSKDLPGARAGAQKELVGISDAFIARLQIREGSPAIITSTYLGGNEDAVYPDMIDEGRAITITPDGTVWVAGETTAPSFPLQGEPLREGGRGNDIFVAGFHPSLAKLERAFLLGGRGADTVRHLTSDAHGNLYLTGIDEGGKAPDVPEHLFLTKINSAQTAVLWSGAIGKTESAYNSGTRHLSIAVGGNGTVAVPLLLDGLVASASAPGGASLSARTSLILVRPRGDVEPPRILSLDRKSATSLAITGSGFAAGVVVRIDGIRASVSASSDGRTLEVTLPAAEGARRIDIINRDGQSVTARVPEPERATGTARAMMQSHGRTIAIAAGGTFFVLLLLALLRSRRRAS